MSKIKGSFLLGIMGQGVSESFVAVDPTTQQNGMIVKLQNIRSRRFALTNGAGDKAPISVGRDQNLLSLVGFRAVDLLKPRAVAVQLAETPGGFNDFAGNMEGNLAAKIAWFDGSQTLLAYTYLHGVPVTFQEVPFANPIRQQAWAALFQTRLNAYRAALITQGLGFLTLNNTPPNAVGAITAVTYNAVTGLFTITTANPVPQGKFRVALRQFRSLRILNGRRVAQATGANTFVVFKPSPIGVWDNTGTAVPISGYNGAVKFDNSIIATASGCTPKLLVPRKLGRPFFLQPGHATRRVG